MSLDRTLKKSALYLNYLALNTDLTLTFLDKICTHRDRATKEMILIDLQQRITPNLIHDQSA